MVFCLILIVVVSTREQQEHKEKREIRRIKIVWCWRALAQEAGANPCYYHSQAFGQYYEPLYRASVDSLVKYENYVLFEEIDKLLHAMCYR